jgi:type IX secretion system substrate protein
MKKLYFILILMAYSAVSFADINPGNFEVRLTFPGGEPGIMRVQMRAIQAPVVPNTGQFCTDLSFAIWWDNVANPGIADLDIDQASSYGGQLQEAAPIPGNSSGSGSPNGMIVNFSLANFFQFPTDWVLNQWVTIGTIGICSASNCVPPYNNPPSGIDATDFLVQGFTGTLPNIQVDAATDYTPGGAPLPLNLIAFQAAKSGDRDAHLTWTTANEENTSHFVVERSFDKQNWEAVGSVGAAGNSVDIRNYELTDLDVNNGRATRVRAYYRLKMVDLDGRSSSSPIESIIYDNDAVTAAVNNFEVFPNPASDGVYITWDQQENLDQPSLMELYDITGKLVFRQVVSDKTDQEYIDLESANVKAGVYMLRIMNGTTPLDHKQIVVGQN